MRRDVGGVGRGRTRRAPVGVGGLVVTDGEGTIAPAIVVESAGNDEGEQRMWEPENPRSHPLNLGRVAMCGCVPKNMPLSGMQRTLTLRDAARAFCAQSSQCKYVANPVNNNGQS